MDGERFDKITRAMASGSSRRSVLKGLLGLGGVAAVASVYAPDSEARRSSGSQRATTTTPAPCPAGTSPCDTNSTGCCVDCGEGLHQCGYDCCQTEAQCCDGECCDSGYDCLTYHFPEGAYVQEETCCPIDQTCDEKCCDGECFDPGSEPFPIPWERICCPAGMVVCEFPDQTRTCIDPTTQCCQNADCPALYGGEDACWFCDEDVTCVPVPEGELADCPECTSCGSDQNCQPDPQFDGLSCNCQSDDDEDDCPICCNGACVEDGSQVFCEGLNACCSPGDSCIDGQCCPAGDVCSTTEGGSICCTGLSCCNAFDDEPPACYDPLSQCCSSSDGSGREACAQLYGGEAACWTCGLSNNSCITEVGNIGHCPTCWWCDDAKLCVPSSATDGLNCGLPSGDLGKCCNAVCCLGSQTCCPNPQGGEGTCCDAGTKCCNGTCIADGLECCAVDGACDGACLSDGTCCTSGITCQGNSVCCEAGGSCCNDQQCCASGLMCCDTSCFECCADTDCPGSSADVCRNGNCCALNSCAVDYPGQCGTGFDDGCGLTIDCDCPDGQVCNGGSCCTPLSEEAACANQCGGTADRGCGLTASCGAGPCPSGLCKPRVPDGSYVCVGTGVCVVGEISCSSQSPCPNGVCDTGLGICVQCLSDNDCPALFPICASGAASICSGGISCFALPV